MPDPESFDRDFFADGKAGAEQYGQWMRQAERALNLEPGVEAYTGASPGQLAESLGQNVCPEQALAPEELWRRLGHIVRNSIRPWHPNTAAHLHTPVVLPALAAEAVLTALNQSMDSFDQAPAATIVEQKVVRWLCELAGFTGTAGGTFTAGGTQANYMGLLLARDYFLKTRHSWSARERGLPPDAHRLRFLCSEVAHFSVEKSAIQLGLGTQAVAKVGCDENFRMRPDLLRAQIASLRLLGLQPCAIVATAGTTDFGSIDPLGEIASIARTEGIWLHVDAAYGGALLLSPKYASRLDGLAHADSVTIDFHKAFFQPISCSAFLLADDRRFESIRVNADYLNSETREAEGVPDLVTRSVLTSRRFDALKLWLSFQAIGRLRFAAMVERLVSLAQVAAGLIRASEALRLVAEPQFGAVVFRYRPEREDAGRINAAIPGLLFSQGKAVIGRAVVNGDPCLKLTLCNPTTTHSHLAALLESIVKCGQELS